MDCLPTNPRCALCGVPATRYVRVVSVRHKACSVPVEWLEDVVLLTQNPATKTIFLLKEKKITFTGFHYYQISPKPNAYERLFPDGRVRVYDNTFLTNVLSFPLHRACYGVFVGLAPRDLHNDVVDRVLYEALQAHFVNREHKEQMPVDLQLQQDFSSDCIEGLYGLNNPKFNDFAFCDPHNTSPKECKRMMQDMQEAGDRWLRSHPVPTELQKDDNGNLVSYAELWRNKFYADAEMSWATGWFPKSSTKIVPNWYRFYDRVDFTGKFGDIKVKDAKKIMNRYRVGILCGKILEEGCAMATSLLPTPAELASEKKHGKRLYAQSSMLDPTKAEFVPGQPNMNDVLTDAFPGYLSELAWFDPKRPSKSGSIGLLQNVDNATNA